MSGPCWPKTGSVLGSGTLFGVSLFGEHFQPWAVFVLPPGGFFVLAFWLILFSAIRQWREKGAAAQEETHAA